MEMKKKIVVQEILENKQIQFIFDEDTNVGLLYQAADKFRALIFEEIKKIHERDTPKEEEMACQEEEKK